MLLGYESFLPLLGQITNFIPQTADFLQFQPLTPIHSFT